MTAYVTEHMTGLTYQHARKGCRLVGRRSVLYGKRSTDKSDNEITKVVSDL